MFSTRDILLFIHDSLITNNSDDDNDWDILDVEEKKKEERRLSYVSDEALKTRVYKNNDEFLHYRNFLIPFVIKLLFDTKFLMAGFPCTPKIPA